MQKKDGVYTVQGPMCNWGMTATDKGEEVPFTGYVRKETKWMTNCKPLADLLEGVCSNVDESAPWHRHVHLINGLAAQAAVYPPALVEAVLRALRQQMLEDGQISELQAAESGPVCEEPFVPPGEWYEYWDDVHGVQLDKKLVEEARQVERDWVKKQGVYEVVPLTMCFEETGKRPISLRWIDTNKGDSLRPNYRSRMVVREIKARKSPSEQIPIDSYSVRCLPSRR